VSTALALAATSRVIASVIDDAVAAIRMALPGVLGSQTTSTSPPDHITTGTSAEETNLNLFLYHVTYNQGWREVGLPTRGPNGNPIGRAPLGIDLHYLLTAYSSGDYEAQMMLGIGMQALHEIPILFRKKIQDVFSAPTSDIDKALATASLDTQIELVKIVPQQIGSDELSKLWTAFQSKFRVSAGYVVSVVLIETHAPVTAPLPVLTRNLVVVPFLEPTIQSVNPQMLPYASGASLTLMGTNLPGRDTVVIFGGAPDSPQTPTVTGNGASVTVPLPTLTAGVNTVQVVRQVNLGVTPETPFVQSNAASFILQPVIRRAPMPPNDYLISVGSPDNSTTPPRVPVTATVDPVFTATQKVSLLLNELNAPAGQTPGTYMFDAVAADLAPPNQVLIYTQGVPAGDYLARIRVDGADSPLDIDSTTKAFVTPKVTF
jgi:Pvc16 N-terminal domain